MLLSILKWSRGYVTILLYGTSPERFMNLCRKKNILLWNMHTCGHYCICNVSVKGFKMLCPIARKTRTRPVIQKKTGMPFLMKRYRNRTGFLAGMMLCLFFLYYSSLFVWKITVEGQYTHTEEEITKFLKTQNIMVGTKISEIDAAFAEEEIRKQFDDIGWVSVEITGTRLYVHLAETNMPVESEQAVLSASDLVASHDGIIRSMITRRGTPVVTENTEVKKGDVLVSGLVEIRGDNEEILERKADIADADIMLETEYTYKDSFPMEYEQASYTGENKLSYGFSVFGYAFFIENPLKTIDKFEKYDIIMDEHAIHLGKNFILPLKIIEKKWREYKSVSLVYTRQEAKEEAEKHINRYLNTLEEKDVEVLEQDLHFTVKPQALKKKKKTASAVSMAAVYGTLKVLEPQKERKKISVTEVSKIEDDKNEDDKNENEIKEENN